MEKLGSRSPSLLLDLYNTTQRCMDFHNHALLFVEVYNAEARVKAELQTLSDSLPEQIAPGEADRMPSLLSTAMERKACMLVDRQANSNITFIHGEAYNSQVKDSF